MEEGRCQGFGTDYVPFIKVGESKSRGTCSAIFDPFEGRLIHCLSQAEANIYYMIRNRNNVKHIREQYLLDSDRMNAIVKEVGLRRAPYWTTDFLVTYTDDSETAFSVKASADAFDEHNRIYRGKESKYHHLVARQYAEHLYWKSQGVEFQLVTNEDVNLNVVANMKAVMAYYNETKVTNTVQKLKFLVAHHYIPLRMDEKVLDFQDLVNKSEYDIDAMYRTVIVAREEYEKRS